MIIFKIHRVDLVGRDDYIPPAKPRGISPADTNLKIHPTAIVGSSARLGENLEIGPYAIVEDGVTVGSDCVIQAHSVLTNNVTIGDRNVIGYGAVIGSPPQDLAHDDSISSGVVIGNDNVFREYVTIHRGSKEGTATRVGHGNCSWPACTSATMSPSATATSLPTTASSPVTWTPRTTSFSAAHQSFTSSCASGAMCMIRGGTAWSKDIPPFTVGVIINKVCGINAIGMKRKGIGTENRAT